MLRTIIRSTGGSGGFKEPVIQKFWQLPISTLEQEIGSGPNGLTTADAALRRARFGPNVLEQQRRLSLPLKFFGRFRNPLVLVLLARRRSRR
jgi:magnesium-transporting ATPase (P-type)